MSIRKLDEKDRQAMFYEWLKGSFTVSRLAQKYHISPTYAGRIIDAKFGEYRKLKAEAKKLRGANPQ
jgi:hypothetical protein